MQAFRKEGPSDRFAAEADGLEALRPHIRVPKVLERGNGYIALEFLPLETTGDWSALGRMLAKLHRQTGQRFGWHRDNYIGRSPQQNGWCDDWLEFWRERRLRFQLEMAKRNGYALEMPCLGSLENHKPQPSLLHGDLWRGNAGFTAQGPVIYDPAVYYGDRETDLAMTELFGGFPREFYRAYDEAFPLPGGYEQRKRLYNLYHLLNHLNIFGGGYLAQVKETLGFLRF